MAYDDEQCPSRGPGLGHVTDDGQTCDHCGKLRIGPAKTALEWWAEMLRSLRPAPPTNVVLSGEANPEAERLGDFASLTAREWHALVVERRYHDSHQCDDRS